MATTYTEVSDITTTYTDSQEEVYNNYDTDTAYDNDIQYNGLVSAEYEEVIDVVTSYTKIIDI